MRTKKKIDSLKEKNREKSHTPKKNRLSNGKLVLKRRWNCATHSWELLPLRKHCRVPLTLQESATDMTLQRHRHFHPSSACFCTAPPSQAAAWPSQSIPGLSVLGAWGLQDLHLWSMVYRTRRIFLVSNLQRKPPSCVAKRTRNHFAKLLRHQAAEIKARQERLCTLPLLILAFLLTSSSFIYSALCSTT